MDDRSDLDFEVVILVSRGDELPKRNYEKRLHPTYETSIRIKHAGKILLNTKPHLVIKFFGAYRDLYDSLVKLGVGESLKVHINAAFPPSYKTSLFGVGLSEDALQERCFMLNKWMQAVFSAYHLFSPEAQSIISQFLSLQDDDANSEANKELILSLMRRRHERLQQQLGLLPPPAVAANEGSQQQLQQPSSVPLPSPSPSLSQQPQQQQQQQQQQQLSQTPATASLASFSKQTSSRSAVSIYSEATPPQLTGAELEEYSKETIINELLAVSVLRGEEIPKVPGDTKLHASYESILRVVPFAELPSTLTLPAAPAVPYTNNGRQQQVLSTVIINKDDLDPDAMAKLSDIPPVAVARVFDGYRQLMQDLEMVGVFSRDHSNKAAIFDEDDDNRRRSIVVDAAFPKTFRRSSLGFGLTEQQAAARVVLLNHWIGALLRSYRSLPNDAQSLILAFFDLEGVSTDSKKGSKQEDEEDEEKQIQLAQNEIILSMLKGSFSPPLIEKETEAAPSTYAHQAAEAARNGRSIMLGMGANFFTSTLTAANDNNSNSDNNKDDPYKEDDEANRPTVAAEVSFVSGINNHPTAAPLGPEAVAEQVVNSFLGVRISTADKLLRKSNDSKLHSAYEITIRILSLPEVTLPEMEKSLLDGQAMARLASLHPSHVSKVFDSYRLLRNALEDKRVFSRDRSEAASSTGGVVIIEASFPPSYSKSALGIGLTSSEKAERAAMLSQYMGDLLSKYYLCTQKAQEVINAFLGLEEDNPAEPVNKFILQVLRRTFRPQIKPPVVPPVVTATVKARKGKSSNSSSSKGAGGEEGGAAAVADNRCRCVIS